MMLLAWVRLMVSLHRMSEVYGVSAQHEWGLWRLCTVWVRFMASLRSKSEAYGVSAQHGRKMFLRKVSNAYRRFISLLMHFLHSEGRLIWVNTWVRLTAALRSVSKAYGVLHTLFTGGWGSQPPGLFLCPLISWEKKGETLFTLFNCSHLQIRLKVNRFCFTTS